MIAHLGLNIDNISIVLYPSKIEATFVKQLKLEQQPPCA